MKIFKSSFEIPAYQSKGNNLKTTCTEVALVTFDETNDYE